MRIKYQCSLYFFREDWLAYIPFSLSYLFPLSPPLLSIDAFWIRPSFLKQATLSSLLGCLWFADFFFNS